MQNNAPPALVIVGVVAATGVANSKHSQWLVEVRCPPPLPGSKEREGEVPNLHKSLTTFFR